MNGEPLRAIITAIALTLIAPSASLAASPSQDDFDRIMSQGAAALQGGDYAQAEAAFRQALAVRPGHPAAQAFLGNTLLATGSVAAATELLEAAATAAPDYFLARQGLGQAYARAGRLPEAASELGAAARIDPENVTTSAMLAQLLLQTGRAREAVAAARNVVRLQPDAYAAQYLLANAQLQAGDPDGALVAFDRALAGRPDDPGARYGRALALAELGATDDAIATVTALLELDQSNAAAWFLLGRLTAAQARQFDAYLLAAEFYREGLARRPGDPVATMALADLFFRLGLFAEGRGLIDDLPESNRSASTEILYGRLSAGLREFGDAVAAYERALDIDASADAWYWLGVAHVNLSDSDAAALAFRAATEMAPEYGVAWRELGKASLDAARIPEAAAALEKALALMPDDAEAHYLYGRSLARGGDHGASRDALERAIEIDPGHREARYNLALALRRLGETERSQQLMTEVQEQMREENGDSAEAIELRGRQVFQQGLARYRVGYVERAAELFGQAAGLLPKADLPRLYESRALADLGRFEDALTAARGAAELDDSRVETWQLLAQLHERLGNAADAAAARERAAALQQ